ncbi:hypothetical protein NPIL_553471 [Nephila pilipes]|uniref:Uncharacterized protein n=1 Tax=Nephila pilipes TaxID=299642 RepID=A0A8X6J4K2_NEPPI|nr:hypothetical protein NPIL_553471 [Nephila pilipes]
MLALINECFAFTLCSCQTAGEKWVKQFVPVDGEVVSKPSECQYHQGFPRRASATSKYPVWQTFVECLVSAKPLAVCLEDMVVGEQFRQFCSSL